MAGPSHEPTIYAARVLWAYGLLLWLVAALVSVWEGLALQSPVSALHVGVLAGPITQLRNGAFAFGAGALLLAEGWPRLFTRGRGRVSLVLVLSGATTQLLALAYAACAGIVAIQLNDPRSDARTALYVRLFAHALTCAGLVTLSMRAFRALRAPSEH